MARYASVYPLVTTRALARPFTYLGDGLAKGDVVVGSARPRPHGGASCRASRKPRRTGSSRWRSSACSARVPPALVDLALWIADVLRLDAGHARSALVAPPDARAGAAAAAPGAEAAALPPERTPGGADGDAGAGARADRRGASGAAGGSCSHGATGSGKTEVYLRACAAALERGARRDRPRARDRAHAAGARPLPRPVRRRGRVSPLRA